MAINRLLVIRGGAVGDFIVTLPVLRALRLTFPQAWIEVLGHPSRICLADHPRYASRVTDIESLDLYRLFQAGAVGSPRLAAYLQSFDLIIAYYPAADGALAQQLARYGGGRVITWPPHPPAGLHVTDYLLQALAPLSLQSVDRSPQIEIDCGAEAMATELWRGIASTVSDKKVVAFHPGSGGRHKLWPLAGWQAVMAWSKREGIAGWVIQGPAEYEREIQAELHASVGDWPWIGELSLPELAALLRRCDVVLSHDSGIAHLAAAAGVTTLALFGPTDPHMWGPRSHRACVLQPRTPQPLTLQNLPPASVIHTLASLLDETFDWQDASEPCSIVRL